MLLDRHRRCHRGQQGPRRPGRAVRRRRHDGAQRWNDANVLAISLGTMSAAVLGEVLDAWFAGAPSDAPDDRANVAHVDAIQGAGA